MLITNKTDISTSAVMATVERTGKFFKEENEIKCKSRRGRESKYGIRLTIRKQHAKCASLKAGQRTLADPLFAICKPFKIFSAAKNRTKP